MKAYDAGRTSVELQPWYALNAGGEAMNKPFENLTVLDLSRYLLGAYPSLYLADFGARVIKVEDTKVGDYCRQEEPQNDG